MSDAWFESPTEQRNERTNDIQHLSTVELLTAINDEDGRVAPAVRRALSDLADLVDAAVRRIRDGGRIHYFGAGSSGRLGLLDAAELIPTFGVSEELVVAHLAGGDAAMRRPREGAEDDMTLGEADGATIGSGDVVIGLTASGRTPYVGGALKRAREVGAFRALVTSNPAAQLAPECDVVVCADTGPEVIAGSTRMKAGTAEKLILNAFSTAVMVQLGMTWANLMINMRMTNVKLRKRMVHLLSQATGVGSDQCAAALGAADGDARVALVALLTHTEPSVAAEALANAGGVVGSAVARLAGPR